MKNFLNFLSTIEPTPSIDPVPSTSVPSIAILDEPATKAPTETVFPNDADMSSIDQADKVLTIETSIPAELDPPDSVHSPIPQDDSIFEFAEDPALKRRRTIEAEASLSPKSVTPPF